jgi:hypothetical protein
MPATPFPNPDKPALVADPTGSGLVGFNLEILEQALGVARGFCSQPHLDYGRFVGPHFRHVIEHYDALLMPSRKGTIDYDQRPRDESLDNDPRVAVMRLETLLKRLLRLSGHDTREVLDVRGLGGTEGDQAFSVRSSLERELVFVAMHAIHHYAMVAQACVASGVELPAGFGRAPATVAHARSLAASCT